MEGIIFADKKRGIFGLEDGCIFFTQPETFVPICTPFFIPSPYRIFSGDEIDPYVVAFSQNGVLFVFDYQKCKCVTTTTLPPFQCIITKVNILAEGKSIELTTESERYLYDGYWRVVEEDSEKLMVKTDQKINSECSTLENEICDACRKGDIKAFQKAVERYCLYLIQYTTIEIFIDSWFELVKRSAKLGKEQFEVLKGVVDLLGSFELIQPRIDEIRMALSVV